MHGFPGDEPYYVSVNNKSSERCPLMLNCPVPPELGFPPSADGSPVNATPGWRWLLRGSVGIFGFNGLQLAMRRPPALKAVISAESTEKIYEEDVHYYYYDMMSSGDFYNFGIDSGNALSPSPDFRLMRTFWKNASTTHPVHCYGCDINATEHAGVSRSGALTRSTFPCC